jgi:hypothetical protein
MNSRDGWLRSPRSVVLLAALVAVLVVEASLDGGHRPTRLTSAWWARWARTSATALAAHNTAPPKNTC